MLFFQMDFLFGRRKTPAELLRQNQRALNKGVLVYCGLVSFRVLSLQLAKKWLRLRESKPCSTRAALYQRQHVEEGESYFGCTVNSSSA